MTTAEFSTVLDSIVSAAFDLATAMPEAAEALHQVAAMATATQERIEADIEADYFDQMARRFEDMADARADAISAGWGWD